MYCQGLRNSNLIHPYLLFFWKILVEEHEKFHSLWKVAWRGKESKELNGMKQHWYHWLFFWICSRCFTFQYAYLVFGFQFQVFGNWKSNMKWSEEFALISQVFDFSFRWYLVWLILWGSRVVVVVFSKSWAPCDTSENVVALVEHWIFRAQGLLG